MRPSRIWSLPALLGSLVIIGCGGNSGGSDPHSSPDGGGAPDSGVPVVGNAPVLESATAQVSGRTGKDLRITVSGKDPDGDIVMTVVRYLDAAGNPVLAFDSNMDGTVESAEGPAALDTAVAGQKAISGVVATVRNVFARYPAIAQVGVKLRDVHGNTSDEVVTSLILQPVRAAGESCDPQSIADRCEASVGCSGTPATCQEGRAPEITRFAFLTSSTGPRLLLDGTEPEDDLDRIHLEFQDANGSSVTVDLDGDGTPDSSSMDLNGKGAAHDGLFFVGMQSAEGFDTDCPQITATAFDLAGHQGAAVMAKATAPTVRNRGAACDPRGFDSCSANLVCTPGIVGATNKCDNATTARAAECKNAPILDPAKNTTVAVGRAQGTSLWDVPLDCSSQNPTNRPEGVAKLHLGTPVAKLTISTENPGTDFDTTVYLLKGCPDTNKDALGCADDSPDGSAASTLVLANVPAGDYLIVIDSFQTTGGNYEVTVKVE